MNEQTFENLQVTIANVNDYLYGSSQLACQNEYVFEDFVHCGKYFEELEQILGIWEKTVSLRDAAPNNVEEEFWEIYDYFKYIDSNTIYRETVERFMALPERIKKEFLRLPIRYTFLKNKMDYVASDFSLIEEHITLMASRLEDYKWLYEHLGDFRSKKILNGIIKYWYTFDIDQMHRMSETLYSDYYDLDILKCDTEEVFVDLGAYVGDSIYDFINTFGNYKKDICV